MEEALQHIVNRFSDAAKNFGLTINLKKTEVLYQPPPRVAYSHPHISIDGTKLNAAEPFTYLGSVISNDATVGKDLDNHLSKASSSFGRVVKESTAESLALPLHKDSGILGHCRSHPPVRCRDLDSLLEADQASGAVINAACVPSLASNGKTMCRTKRSSREPASQHRVHLASGAAALGWPHLKVGRRMHAQSSLLQ